jgi:hypothetical protein
MFQSGEILKETLHSGLYLLRDLNLKCLYNLDVENIIAY